jgi:hypothetical protein
MLPNYPLNQLRAIDDSAHSPPPASRLDVHMQMLEHERQRHLTMLAAVGTGEHPASNPLMVMAHAFSRAAAALLAMAEVQAQRLRLETTSGAQGVAPGDHICVPGVDC